MKKFKTLLAYEFRETLLSRWFLFFLISYNFILYVLFYFTNQMEQVYASLLNAVLYFNFIVVLFFSVLTWQNSAEFISLVLSQPVSRGQVFWSRLISFLTGIALFTGVSLILQVSLALDQNLTVQLLGTQFLIQMIATGTGLLIATAVEDRLKAIALAGGVIVLLVFALDAIELAVMVHFSAYPLEKTILFLSLLNPLSVLRYQSLIDQNNSLWIGYAGLLLSRTWHSGILQGFSFLALGLWLSLPIFISRWLFQRKDL